VFWNLPQLQFKNKNVQIVTLKNMTPSPFIKIYFSLAEDNISQLLIDIESKTNEEIENHLINVIGKSKETLEAEAIMAEKKDNPANMGVGCLRPCICEVPGQVPCPGIVPLPNKMRGKYIFQKS
jgi:small subunit ribosomal protein S25